VTEEDFERFDLVLAMDRANLLELRAIAPGPRALAKVGLLRELDPASAGGEDLDVPDPYYGGARGFDAVLDLVTAACRGLLDDLRARQSA
jgi:protein-tyrosine phosphatase